MTYQEFKNKYNGKYVDYDGYYGAQCWDLAQKYFTEVLGVPSWVLSGCGNVCNMLIEPKLSDLLLYFDEVKPTEMEQGDVAIWSANHIAIVDHYDGNPWYFSQNPNPCQVMVLYLDGLRAFRLKEKYRPKTEVVEKPTETPQISTNEENNTNTLPNIETSKNEPKIEEIEGNTSFIGNLIRIIIDATKKIFTFKS